MLRIARRGAWGYEQENTLAAFRKATKISCDVVEFDVHRTVDHHVIVMHDHTVRRTTDGIGKIHELTLRELRRFHERNGETVPLLEEVVEILNGKRRMMVDIKDRGMEGLVLNALHHKDAVAQAIIDSDLAEVIEEMRELDDEINLFLGCDPDSDLHDVIRQATRLRAGMIKVKNTHVTPAIVNYAHTHGMGIYVWGAEDAADIRQMLELQVDALVCMFPDRIPVPL